MASIAVAACAAPATEPELRVLVKLPQASSDGNAIARRAGDVSGVPVRYVAASSGTRWPCGAAMRRRATKRWLACAQTRAPSRVCSATNGGASCRPDDFHGEQDPMRPSLSILTVLAAL